MEHLRATQIEMVCWTTFLVTQETQSCLSSNVLNPCWCCNWNMLRESHSHWSADASVSSVLGHLILIRPRQSDFTPAEMIFHRRRAKDRESWSWWDPGPSVFQPEENAILTLNCKSVVWNSLLDYVVKTQRVIARALHSARNLLVAPLIPFAFLFFNVQSVTLFAFSLNFHLYLHGHKAQIQEASKLGDRFCKWNTWIEHFV